ncbi:hypothetical protein P43SY_000910 [Pythium insidiosum]|uniref:Kinesin motor domain-containing protein n=1 Tax=Pythium insidiosum TaxID=114742 RepID=A0AAD5Q6Q8_PYTIN|nr:hypothetical protein P43SY_000910 [Pythium insidiosum]
MQTPKRTMPARWTARFKTELDQFVVASKKEAFSRLASALTDARTALKLDRLASDTRSANGESCFKSMEDIEAYVKAVHDYVSLVKGFTVPPSELATPIVDAPVDSRGLPSTPSATLQQPLIEPPPAPVGPSAELPDLRQSRSKCLRFCNWRGVLTNSNSYAMNARIEMAQALLACGLLLRNEARVLADGILSTWPADVREDDLKIAYQLLLHAAGIFEACLLALDITPEVIEGNWSDLSKKPGLVNGAVRAESLDEQTLMEKWREEQRRAAEASAGRASQPTPRTPTGQDAAGSTNDDFAVLKRIPDLANGRFPQVMAWVALVEAQELVILRGVSREFVDFSLMAKLSNDNALRFRQSHSFASRHLPWSTSPVAGKLRQYCMFKDAYYAALSCYFQGAACMERGDARNCAKAIANFRKATTLIRHATQRKTAYDATLGKDEKDRQFVFKTVFMRSEQIIKRDLDIMTRRNDSVFYERIPEPDAACEPVSLVKAVEFPSLDIHQLWRDPDKKSCTGAIDMEVDAAVPPPAPPSALAPTTASTSATSTPSAPHGEAENIAVCIRVRPLNEREVRNKDVPVLRTVNALNLISITDRDGQPLPGKQNVFQYDHIFDATSTTRAMYDRVAKRIVRSALDGINGTIFAYGQTSSGKTYTMTGASGSAVPDASGHPGPGSGDLGILQLAVEDIFSFIEQSTDRDFLLRVSFVEIYNEVVKDLLTPESDSLKLREDPRKGVYVECREEIITTVDDILRLLHEGTARRSVGTTAMNDRSSRSHSIFRVVIESKQKSASRRQSEDDVNGAVLVACLSLVDLAGSESVRHTAADGLRQREAGNINKSLLTLSRVINTLASSAGQGHGHGAGGAGGVGGAGAAPFRDSKLTRLLQNSLDGNTRTLIVCCVTPSDRYLDETKSTLQFAARAKTIQTSAHVNEILDDHAQLRRLKREVHELKRLLNGRDAYHALKAENEALQHEQNKNKAEIARLLGLVLSSSNANSDNSSSSGSSKAGRSKRARETWCPGDFAANVERRRLEMAASPTRQRRKRTSRSDSEDGSMSRRGAFDELKENVNPQNAMGAMHATRDRDDCEDDDDDELDGNVGDNQNEADGSKHRKRRRVRPDDAALRAFVREIEALVHDRLGPQQQQQQQQEEEEAEAGDEQPVPPSPQEDRNSETKRLARLRRNLEALLEQQHVAPAQLDSLVGENEVLKMRVSELTTRLDLSQQADDELAAAKAAMRVSELTTRLDLSQQADDELAAAKAAVDDANKQLAQEREVVSKLQAEQAAWESVRDALESQVSLLQAEYSSRSEKAAVGHEDLQRRVSELTEETSRLQAEIEALKQHEEEVQRVHDDLVLELEVSSKSTIDELTRQLETAFVEIEELKLVKEEEVTKLEEELLLKTDEMDEKVAEFAERERAIQEENERLQRERESLNEAMVALEQQLQQTSGVHGELETRLSDLAAEKASLEGLVAKLREELASSSDEDATKRVALEEQLRVLREEASTEKERLTTEATESESRYRSELESLQHTRDDLQSKMTQLSNALAEKDEQLLKLDAAAAEATAYKDFVQREMDEVMEQHRELEVELEALRSENSTLRHQLADLKQQVEVALSRQHSLDLPAEFAGEIDQLQEALERLQSELSAKIEREAQLTNDCATLRKQNEEQQGENARLQETVRTLREEASTKPSSEDLPVELARLREERWGLATRVEEAEQALDQERRELQRLSEELEAASQSSADLETKLKEREEELERLSAAATDSTELEAQLRSQVEEEREKRLALAAQVSSMQERLEMLVEEKQSFAASAAADLATSDRVRSELVDELSALETQLMELSQEKMALQVQLDESTQQRQVLETATSEKERAVSELQTELDAANEALRTLQATSEATQQSQLTKIQELETAITTLKQQSTEVDTAAVERLEMALAEQTQLRAKLELDVQSFQETVDLLRTEAKTSSDKCNTLQISLEEATASKSQLEAASTTLQAELSRSREEQDELRYQYQQRLLSSEEKEAALLETIQTLEQQVADAKRAVAASTEAVDARVAEMVDRVRVLEMEVDRAQREKVDAETLLSDLRARHEAALRDVASLKAESESALAEQQRLQQTMAATEAEWREREDELTRKAHFEMTSLREQFKEAQEELEALREQFKEAQEELEAYQKYADDEIRKLRVSIEQSDSEMLELNSASHQREEQLQASMKSLEESIATLQRERDVASAQAAEARQEMEALTTRHQERISQGTALVAQLQQDLESAKARAEEDRSQYREMKAAMEKLEGEAYQRRNEMEELTESLKSAQMEAMHYHSQLAEVQLAKEQMSEVLETQKKRIEKLEKVKMTTETLELFRKLKSDRSALQAQVDSLRQDLEAATRVSQQTRQASEQQQQRLLQVKEEEVRMLKEHVAELGQALKAEKDKAVTSRSELRAAVDDVMEKTQREIREMQVLVQEKNEQIVALRTEIASLEKERLGMQDSRTSKESFLEKENLELLVENRKLKKRLESRGGSSMVSSYATMDADVAAFEASARAATALLAEPPTASAFSVDAAPAARGPSTPETKATPAPSSESKRRGLASFLLSSGSTSTNANASAKEEEEEARPACAQQ